MVDFEILINYGVMGIMLLWFMYRMEATINKNTDAVNNNSKIIEAILFDKKK